MESAPVEPVTESASPEPFSVLPPVLPSIFQPKLPVVTAEASMSMLALPDRTPLATASLLKEAEPSVRFEVTVAVVTPSALERI
jgi:hypothetical protein